MVEGLEGYSYSDRLRILGLTTLETRFLRADLMPLYLYHYRLRIYQDPSMKILSWMAIGRGKKHTLINTPSRSSSDDQASS